MSRKRPTGVYTPITPEWQKRVREELANREWDQGDLARILKCSDGAISGMLAEGARSSRLVEPTNLALNIAAPLYEDEIDQEAHLAFKKLRKRNRELFDKLVQDAMRANRRPTDGDPEPSDEK